MELVSLMNQWHSALLTSYWLVLNKISKQQQKASRAKISIGNAVTFYLKYLAREKATKRLVAKAIATISPKLARRLTDHIGSS